jgi:hypothetical protein
MLYDLAVLYKDCSNYAPRMKRGLPGGIIDLKKQINKHLEKTHKAYSFDI